MIISQAVLIECFKPYMWPFYIVCSIGKLWFHYLSDCSLERKMCVYLPHYTFWRLWDAIEIEVLCLKKKSF